MLTDNKNIKLLAMKKTDVLNEISINYAKTTVYNDPVASSNDAAQIARKIYEHTQSNIELKEYFFVMYLNRRNQVLGYYKLSEGGMCSTVADQRIAFATGLKCLATSVILVHNHPSGSLKPSDPDIRLTRNFKSGGDLLDISVLDHLILSKEGYFSFADEGLL
jgi:DNA repair protein RadC